MCVCIGTVTVEKAGFLQFVWNACTLPHNSSTTGSSSSSRRSSSVSLASSSLDNFAASATLVYAYLSICLYLPTLL